MAAATAVLLLGGAGTFSNWREAEPVGSGNLTAGHLDWTVDAGAWHDITAGLPGAVITDISLWRMVPGDKLQYSTTIDVDLVGDRLDAVLAADVSGTGGLATGAHVTITADVNNSGTPSLSVTDSVNDVPVTVTVEMPFNDDVVGNEGEDLTLDLSSLELTLTQTANP